MGRTPFRLCCGPSPPSAEGCACQRLAPQRPTNACHLAFPRRITRQAETGHRGLLSFALHSACLPWRAGLCLGPVLPTVPCCTPCSPSAPAPPPNTAALVSSPPIVLPHASFVHAAPTASRTLQDQSKQQRTAGRGGARPAGAGAEAAGGGNSVVNGKGHVSRVAARGMSTKPPHSSSFSGGSPHGSSMLCSASGGRQTALPRHHSTAGAGCLHPDLNHKPPARF